MKRQGVDNFPSRRHILDQKRGAIWVALHLLMGEFLPPGKTKKAMQPTDRQQSVLSLIVHIHIYLVAHVIDSILNRGPCISVKSAIMRDNGLMTTWAQTITNGLIYPHKLHLSADGNIKELRGPPKSIIAHLVFVYRKYIHCCFCVYQTAETVSRLIFDAM